MLMLAVPAIAGEGGFLDQFVPDEVGVAAFYAPFDNTGGLRAIGSWAIIREPVKVFNHEWKGFLDLWGADGFEGAGLSAGEADRTVRIGFGIEFEEKEFVVYLRQMLVKF